MFYFFILSVPHIRYASEVIYHLFTFRNEEVWFRLRTLIWFSMAPMRTYLCWEVEITHLYTMFFFLSFWTHWFKSGSVNFLQHVFFLFLWSSGGNLISFLWYSVCLLAAETFLQRSPFWWNLFCVNTSNLLTLSIVLSEFLQFTCCFLPLARILWIFNMFLLCQQTLFLCLISCFWICLCSTPNYKMLQELLCVK